MDFSHTFTNPSLDQSLSKLSPLTSAETLSEAQQKNFLSQTLQIETQFQEFLPINKLISFNSTQNEDKISLIPNRVEIIQKNVMEYFQRKGVVAGHPQEWRKEYQRKLHKKISMVVEVSQVINDKAEEGSSLLSRRLKKKMTITL